MELKDTVEMMLSDDYKERFRAEYWQLKIRYDKLRKMVDNWDNTIYAESSLSITYMLMDLNIPTISFTITKVSNSSVVANTR